MASALRSPRGRLSRANEELLVSHGFIPAEDCRACAADDHRGCASADEIGATDVCGCGCHL